MKILVTAPMLLIAVNSSRLNGGGVGFQPRKWGDSLNDVGESSENLINQPRLQISIPKGDLHSDYTPRYPRSEILGLCNEDDFEYKSHLGSGAFGAGYEALHTPTGYLVVLKLYYRVPLSDKEETIPKRLNHPNIMKHHCSYRLRKGGVALVSDFYSGGPLRLYVERGRGAVSTRTLVKWIAQMYSSARYMNEKGVAHGDFHLSNLLVDGEGDLKVIDFGNAGIFSWTALGWEEIDNRLQMMSKEYRKMAQVVSKLCKMMLSEKQDECISFLSTITATNRDERVYKCYEKYAENKKHELFRDFDWSSLP